MSLHGIFFCIERYFFVRYICLLCRLILFRLSFPLLSLPISLPLILSLPAVILPFTVPCHMSLAATIVAFILVVFIALASPVSFHLANVAPSAGICLSADTRTESSWICLGACNISLRPYGLVAAFAIKTIVPVLPPLIISLYFIFLPQYTYKGVGLDAAFRIRVIRIFSIPHVRFDKASPTPGKQVQNNCFEANVRGMEVGVWELIHMVTKSLQCV